ncbi:MAG TPA: hemolysin family protein [Propionicimonas sp.]|nr:hemolysin family protein [Propionicimonas sp.]
MPGYGLDMALIALLILLNAAFAGSEMALISLREGQLRHLEREAGARALRLVRLARDPNRFLATIQIGITLAGFLASATAAVSLAQPLVPSLAFLGSAAEPVSIASVTLVLTFLTLVFGELAPKRLAMQKALPWALLVARPLDLISTISRPAVALLGASTNLVVRLLGGRPDAAAEELGREELRDLVTSHRSLNPEQREIITGAFELHDRMLREVFVPRGSVFSLRGDVTVGEARVAMAEAGHSRAPVTAGTELDDVVGVVHWRSLVLSDGAAPVRSVATPALVLPDTVRISNALREFKAERQQLAIVMDEYGAADGIVTLEDLLEEIVGEIYDEADSDIVGIEVAEDGSVTLPGSFPLHDLADLGVHIELPDTRDFTTVAGLVLASLGRIPDEPGDVVELKGWSIEVLEVARHAVTRVQLRPNSSRRPSPQD